MTASQTERNSQDCLPTGPVRKIGPTRRSMSGTVVLRNGRDIVRESTLERDFVIRKDFFLHVLDVIPQPVEIPFTVESGRSYRYTPDFLVVYRASNAPPELGPKPELVEVKPEKEWRAHWRAWSRKWKAARRYAKARGWQFRIHDETRIRDQTLKNIQWLERYKRMNTRAWDNERIIAFVKGVGQASFATVLDEHFGGIYQSEGIAHLWHLLAIRRLDCDISRPLSNDTELWVPDDE